MSKFSREKILQILRTYKETGSIEETARREDADPRAVRNHVERAKNRSITTVNYIDASGQQPPVGVQEQVPGIEPKTTIVSPTRTREELEAEAFVLFEKEIKPEQVVIELKAPSQLIQKFYESYQKMKGFSGLVELYRELGPSGFASNKQLNDDMKARNMKSNDYVGYLQHLSEFVSLKGEIAHIRKMTEYERGISAAQIKKVEEEVEKSSEKLEDMWKQEKKLTIVIGDATTKLRATKDELEEAQNKLTFIKSQEFDRVFESKLPELVSKNEEALIKKVHECLLKAMAKDPLLPAFVIEFQKVRQEGSHIFTEKQLEEFNNRTIQNASKVFRELCLQIWLECMPPPPSATK